MSTKKAFFRLKDKQIKETLARILKVSVEAIEKFKDSDEYSDKLCNYYVEGFDLFRNYLTKHNPELDFSKLDMEEVEREILANRCSEAIAENVEAMEVIATTALANLSSSNLL